MRTLKVLVVLMGVVLLAGFVLVVVVLAQRLGGEEVGPPLLPRGLVLDLPAGAAVIDMAGTSGRIALRVRLAEGGERLYILDPMTGRVTGAIEVRPPPP